MRTARRDFMRNVGIGSAAVVGSSALGATLGSAAAGAQANGADEQISGADQATLTYLEGVELAAAAAFTQAIARQLLNAATTEICRTFSSHHRSHGDAIAALVGGATAETVPPNAAVLAEASAQIQGAATDQALLDVLAGFSERVAATSQAALGTIGSLVGASVVSRISPVDAQQAAVLGQYAGRPPSEWLPLTQPTAGAFAPTAQPA